MGQFLPPRKAGPQSLWFAMSPSHGPKVKEHGETFEKSKRKGGSEDVHWMGAARKHTVCHRSGGRQGPALTRKSHLRDQLT